MTFTDTQTIVIGGSSGIGYATAEQIIDSGGDVVIAARDDDRRQEAANTLGPNATEHPLDITVRADVKSLFTEFDADYLVCTPAHIPTGFDISEAQLRKAFDVKFFGYYYAAEAARDVLPEDGAIVFLSGESSVDPQPDYFASGVVNAAVECLTRYLAVEYAPVRISAVSPKIVDTVGMTAEMREQAAEDIPIGQIADPADIADAVCFMLQNPNVTGEVLRSNGGARLV
ncbi:SDR family oxidoreductase [Haloarcula sp. JP-L23]|uniref:SDR family oxidoreductase n=1 Tax=Haloarcula sp. JP-L23 TaxID=2716717 RepID=UPI00140ED5D9|nr:SDR family oxidoreductase [Haloarcula sp. JP-L23]